MRNSPDFRYSLFDFEDWFTPNSYGSDFRSLPRRAGVYLLVAVNIYDLSALVCYVGMSANLSKRLENHPIKRLCENRFPYIKTYFQEVLSGRRQQEKNLIKKFDPPFNLIHREIGLI